MPKAGYFNKMGFAGGLWGTKMQTMPTSTSNLRHTFLLVFAALFFLCGIPDSRAQTPSTKSERKARSAAKWDAHMKRLWKDWLYVGAEVITPQFRYGYKATQPWVGPNFMVAGGFFQASFLRGTAEVKDSAKTFRQKGFLTTFGFNFPIPMIVKRGFECYPLVGFGFNVSGLDDRRKKLKDVDVDATQFGFYLKPGLLVKLGPAVATLSYVVSIGGNFTSRNAVAPFTHYPSVGLLLNSMPIIMNPR